jgi:hypothetical protein
MASTILAAVTYLTRVPETVPVGKIVLHNRVKWQQTLGAHGFRAWLDDHPPKEHYKLCTCGWAPHLKEHYRSAPPRK